MPYRVAATTSRPPSVPEARPDDALHAKRAALGVVLGIAGSALFAALAGDVAALMPPSAVEISAGRSGAETDVAFGRSSRIVPVTALVFPMNRPGPEWGASAEVLGSRFGADGTRVVFHYPPHDD